MQDLVMIYFSLIGLCIQAHTGTFLCNGPKCPVVLALCIRFRSEFVYVSSGDKYTADLVPHASTKQCWHNVFVTT